jgi:hypothetical protein
MRQYGQKWSKYIPALGADPTILPAMRQAEELLATLRSICDIIAAERSLLFGPYAHKHSAALCPSGMPAFLTTPSTLRGAYNFAKVLLPVLRHYSLVFTLQNLTCPINHVCILLLTLSLIAGLAY